MAPASQDERTRLHERAKDKAFLGAILIGIALLVLGIVLISWGRFWVFLGGFAFLLGGSFTLAAVLGFRFRRKARKTLQNHEWITTAARIEAQPAAGRKGRTIIELPEQGVRMAVSGLDPQIARRIDKDGQLEFAGELSKGSMLFVRHLDGDRIYVAIVPSRQ